MPSGLRRATATGVPLAFDALAGPGSLRGVDGSWSSWFVKDGFCHRYVAFMSPGPIQHTGHESCMVKPDDGHNLVEANEEGNVYHCAMAGTPVASVTWGTIRPLYR